MLKQAVLFGILASGIITGACHALQTNPEDADLVGVAVDTKTKQPVYIERHSFVELDGERQLQTVYVTPDNKALAKRVVVFEPDTDRVQRYRLVQSEIGYQESIENLTITELIGEKQKQKTINISKKGEVIIDAGFSSFILQNWDDLNAGKTLGVNFASPARMGLIKLQIKRVEQKEQEDGITKFEMNAANALIRLLISPIEIDYYTDSRQLARYRGMSNLQDANGDYYNVEIKFIAHHNASGDSLALR